ncbi:MAG: hypothetical protein AVDCRST_MAG07-1787, partial [uncultured Frankineae bacterium]
MSKQRQRARAAREQAEEQARGAAARPAGAARVPAEEQA